MNEMNNLFMLKSLLNIVSAKHLGNKQIEVGGIPFIDCVLNMNSFHLSVMAILRFESNISKYFACKSYRCVHWPGRIF